jgi:uncharacterized protein (TIGR03118 family)
MTGLFQRSYRSVLAFTGILTLTLGLALASPATAGSEQKCYLQHNLVSDIPNLADTHDENLRNPWGLAFGPTSPFWVANNHTDTSTLYNGAGVPFPIGSPLVVSVEGGPTGVVFNGTSDFVVGDTCPPSGSDPCPGLFIFATEAGTIAGWSPFVPPPPFSHTTVVKQTVPDAIYKGLAIANIGPNNYLYAANFHAGTIDVFDKNFDPFLLPPGAFVDPKLPAGYAPFNVTNLGGKLYVAYAKQDEEAEDEVAGKGKGFVDIFNPDGTFVQRVASRGKLNAPWGMAIAPDNFGRFSGDLLIGNFGDGFINAYTPEGDHFHFHGQLQGADGQPVQIDGLWALAFGTGAPNNGPANALFFTAGINDEENGLFGNLTAHTKAECGNP